MIRNVRRWSIRARLSLTFGALFVLAGLAMMVVTYLLVQQSLTTGQTNKTMLVTAPIQKSGGGTEKFVVDGKPMTAAQLKQALVDQQRAYRAATLDSLLTRSGIALAITSIGAVGLGWLVAGRALRPVHRITATARRVADRSLHERIALRGPRDEIRELADTFDDMLARLDRSFDSQRRFVANASHELRTPLAINRTLIEVAMARPNAPTELTRLGENLLAVNTRHERLIDGLLTLAHSDHGLTTRTDVDLATLVQRAVPATGDRSIAVVTELAPAPTSGDPLLLERLVRNLVDNALRYNTPAGSVWIRTEATADTATLVVENTGPELADTDLGLLFEPFRRAEGDRTRSATGTGLGLSIVRAVTQAHAGAVTATPRAGGGLTVTLDLPTRPAPAT
ncbi:two-component sensor histidine kinase [Actinocatenispora thailandica]|uniref:histidine kinase n=1 Tax=Actinocatenispora thailandica TaxID=227318 RepID=A0A7R7DVT1_9ACTN|nr:ATP-binding protein [Actinocatenispora thailandica]BCJ38790.1 two-component sensor histidine kinase [Actinocatenispora thailandica]